MDKKAFLQISFQWMFAIIVGIVILFLAIYGVVRFMGTGEKATDVRGSKEIGILLNPLETGFEEARTSSITFPSETRINNVCDDFTDPFGRQGISMSQKSFNRWSDSGIPVYNYNRYIFSNKTVEGRKVILFSKPFDFPFKVGNLIYMTSSKDTYCFLDAPDRIKREIENLGMDNVIVEDCEEYHIYVCFMDKCEIEVDYDRGIIEKRGERTYFKGDALMYAGIFADKETYECQLKRLMKRVANLAELYIEKSNFVSTAGCDTQLNSDLGLLASSAKGLGDSGGLDNIYSQVERIDRLNSMAYCKLW